MSTAAQRVVFSSGRFGYHFALPTEGWLRYPAQEENKVGADLLVEHPGIGAIKCVVTVLEADYDELCDMAIRAYQSDMREFRLLGSGAAEIAGIGGVYIEFEGVPHDSDGTRVCFLAHLFMTGGYLFQVIGFSPAGTFSRLRYEAGAAVSSFAFGAVPQAGAVVDPMAEDAVVPGAQAVIGAGLQWGVWGAIVGLCLGIFALSNGAGVGGLSKTLLVPYFCLFFGCFGAGLRWGTIAGNTGSGMEVMDGLIWVACIPFHIMEFMMCTAFGVGSVGVAQLMTNMARFIYGFLSASLAGIPYAAYVMLTRRVHASAAAYLFFAAVGFFPCLFAFALLMFLITGPIDETGGLPGASVAQVDTSPAVAPGQPGLLPGNSGRPGGPGGMPGGLPPGVQPPDPKPAEEEDGSPAMMPGMPGILPLTDTQTSEPELSEVPEPTPDEVVPDAEELRAAYESLKDHPDPAVRRRAKIWDKYLGMREWTDASGRFTVRAKYLERSEGEVTLEREGGAEITVELAKLDDTDRKWVDAIDEMRPRILEDLQRPRTMPEQGPRGLSRRSRR